MDTDVNADSEQALSPRKAIRCRIDLLLVVISVVGVAWLVYPAMQAIRCGSPVRIQCSDNLKQLALAMHNYHDDYGSFPPPYIADETGHPMHSWRVLVLPYLNEEALYNQYDFYEPWDGPNNRTLLAHAPRVFRCPSFDGDQPTDLVGESMTQYFVVLGHNAAFREKMVLTFKDFLDGTNNSLLIVEAHSKRVAWTAPIDVSPDDLVQAQIVEDSLSSHPGGFQAAFADGSVHFISATVDSNTIRLLSTINDGEPIPSY